MRYLFICALITLPIIALAHAPAAHAAGDSITSVKRWQRLITQKPKQAGKELRRMQEKLKQAQEDFAAERQLVSELSESLKFLDERLLSSNLSHDERADGINARVRMLEQRLAATEAVADELLAEFEALQPTGTPAIVHPPAGEYNMHGPGDDRPSPHIWAWSSGLPAGDVNSALHEGNLDGFAVYYEYLDETGMDARTGASPEYVRRKFVEPLPLPESPEDRRGYAFCGRVECFHHRLFDPAPQDGYTLRWQVCAVYVDDPVHAFKELCSPMQETRYVDKDVEQ